MDKVVMCAECGQEPATDVDELCDGCAEAMDQVVNRKDKQ